jgi:hypothetical protein
VFVSKIITGLATCIVSVLLLNFICKCIKMGAGSPDGTCSPDIYLTSSIAQEIAS